MNTNEIYNNFIKAREDYYSIAVYTEENSFLTKLIAKIKYTLSSLKLLRLALVSEEISSEEKRGLIFNLVIGILGGLTKLVGVISVVICLLYIVSSAVLFLFFICNHFHAFPVVNDFICGVLPSGMQPSDNFLIGYTRMFAWGITAVISFLLILGVKTSIDQYREDTQESEDNKDKADKLVDLLVYMIKVIPLVVLMLGIVWFLCFYMDLSMWTLVMKKTGIYTLIIGLIWLGIIFGNGGTSVDAEEYISVLIPKSWL